MTTQTVGAVLDDPVPRDHCPPGPNPGQQSGDTLLSALESLMTAEVVDAHPACRIDQPSFSIDHPESLIVSEVAQRQPEDVDVTRRDLAARQRLFEQQEEVARVGPQPRHASVARRAVAVAADQ